MKKMIMMLLMAAATSSAFAISYQQAKREALFLADKMAYELNLTDEQYEAAYEANLDYLMAVNDRSQLYGNYWTRRNTLLQLILAPAQYASYVASSYFYRPLYWANNSWQWHVYTRYGRSRYYRGRPSAYLTYRGGRPIEYYRGRQWYVPAPSRMHRPYRGVIDRPHRRANHHDGYPSVRPDRSPRHHDRGNHYGQYRHFGR